MQHEQEHDFDSDRNTLWGGRTHGNAQQNKRWATRYLGATSVPDAVCDGFHVVPVRGSTEVTHFTTGPQQGELLAGGAARGIQPNALCLYEDLVHATLAGRWGLEGVV